MSEKVSFSGRAVNFFQRRLPGLAKGVSRRQAAQYVKSGGTKGNTINGKPTFRLTVVGRTSGEPRSVMLMLIRRGDDLLVCGSQGGTPDAPNWWKNLEAAGRATAQVGSESFEVDARVVTDAGERAEAWSLLTAGYPDFATYQQLTNRVLPIAVLTRRAAGAQGN